MAIAWKHVLVRLAEAALGSIALVAALACAWLVFAEYARAQRELKTPEELAGARSRWVVTAEAKLHLQEWGDAGHPTLLLTHGTGAWSGTWFELPGQLAAAGWHVVALDLPPFGLSSSGGDYSRQAQARRILATVDAMGAPVTLIGHSFGAGPALEAALQAGPKVNRLVLVDPALGLGSDGSPPRCEDSGKSWLLNSRGARTSLVSATATWPPLTATMLKQFVHRKEVVTPELVLPYQAPFVRSGFSANLGDWAAAFADSTCEAAASLQPSQLTAWSNAGPSVSLIWGEQDEITPLAQARALMRWMPRASLRTLPGVGHIPHIEDPQAFQRTLLGVLADAAAVP